MTNSSARLTWEEPPAADEPDAPARADVAKALARRPGRWAIVAYCDRVARAATVVERITDGREYGPGFQAVHRRVGNQHRVYARFLDTGQ